MAPAYGDSIDDLCRTLATDASWRVRLQAVAVLEEVEDPRALPALRQALGDTHESVRGLAVEALGRRGDKGATALIETMRRADRSRLVRRQATMALAALGRGRRLDAEVAALHIEVGGIGAGAKTPAALRGQLRQLIVQALARTPGITIEGRPLSGFLIDSAITRLQRVEAGAALEVTCEISFVVGRLPSRAMVMMTSGGATVQTGRRHLSPAEQRAIEIDALAGAVEGAHQNLLTYLKRQREI